MDSSLADSMYDFFPDSFSNTKLCNIHSFIIKLRKTRDRWHACRNERMDICRYIYIYTPWYRREGEGGGRGEHRAVSLKRSWWEYWVMTRTRSAGNQRARIFPRRRPNRRRSAATKKRGTRCMHREEWSKRELPRHSRLATCTNTPPPLISKSRKPRRQQPRTVRIYGEGEEERERERERERSNNSKCEMQLRQREIQISWRHNHVRTQIHIWWG